MLTANARATIMDACQSISRSADELKNCHTIDGDWDDDLDAKAFYAAELSLLGRLTALLSQAPTERMSDAVRQDTEPRPENERRAIALGNELHAARKAEIERGEGEA